MVRVLSLIKYIAISCILLNELCGIQASGMDNRKDADKPALATKESPDAPGGIQVPDLGQIAIRRDASELPELAKKLAEKRQKRVSGYNNVQLVLLDQGFVDFLCLHKDELFGLDISHDAEEEMKDTLVSFQLEMRRISNENSQLDLIPDLKPAIQAALLEQATTLRRDSNQKVNRWCKEYLGHTDACSIASLFIRSDGFQSISSEIVAMALSLTDSQQEKLRALIDEIKEIDKKKFSQGSDYFLKNPTALEKQVACGFKIYDVLDEKQTVAYLRLSGRIGSDETTHDWLRAMPEDRRSRHLKGSSNLNKLWNP